MSDAIITAAAWIGSEPKVNETKEGEAIEFLWGILAEASVTSTDGEPIHDLKKGSWEVHVTDASGVTIKPPFKVAPVVPVLAPAPIPGFYLLTVESFPTVPWVMPTALGLAVANRKLGLTGQVVVPIALAGPTVVSAFTTPSF